MTATRIYAAVLALTPLAAAAQADFPSKPVTLVVPFAAGGPSDKIARDLAEAMRKPLGQPVIVDNAAGAGGTIGSAKVAKATPLASSTPTGSPASTSSAAAAAPARTSRSP